MIAFVLSGGGNLGALQAGALQVLFEVGIRPDLLAGTSAGALNAAYLAAEPTLGGTRRLAALWRHACQEDVFPGGLLRTGWQILRRRESLYPNGRLLAFVQAHMPGGVRCFGDLSIPLYVPATELQSGSEYLFGEDPNESVLDAVMASSAVPPFLPPWLYRGRLFVDGCFVSNLPVRAAIEHGATTIYALEICADDRQANTGSHAWQVALRSVAHLVDQQVDHELAEWGVGRSVKLHHMRLNTHLDLTFRDLDQADRLVDEGRAAAEAYLHPPERRGSPARRSVALQPA